MDAYLPIKLIHILSATLLFGTGLGTAFYMWRAHGSGDVRAIATVARNVVMADWLFTTPAVIVQPISGVWLASLRGYALSEPWIVASLVLYAVAGACWVPVVWLQMRMRALAEAALRTSGRLDSRYHRCMRWWFVLGWPAFAAVLIIYGLMVFKHLPGW
ncbi:MAG: DUF2269 domain-containing protein [Gammaproteobacteria bacterium]|nr:DUF2269 domain-containing protein [Gammaproteobacteria bacterium]